MFHIKICGVRTAQDIDSVARAGADAIGLNFFPKSVRYVDPDALTTVGLSGQAEALGLARVGVFVNEAIDQIRSVADRVGLDQIQLHGDEPHELASGLIDQGLTVVRAVKLPRHPIDPGQIRKATASWVEIGCTVLLDADAGSQHGGAGQTLDWQSIGRWADQHPSSRWVLAGGLTPENVAEAIAACQAKGVDVASGVEQPRGVKSADRINRFAMLAKQALRPV